MRADAGCRSSGLSRFRIRIDASLRILCGPPSARVATVWTGRGLMPLLELGATNVTAARYPHGRDSTYLSVGGTRPQAHASGARSAHHDDRNALLGARVNPGKAPSAAEGERIAAQHPDADHHHGRRRGHPRACLPSCGRRHSTEMGDARVGKRTHRSMPCRIAAIDLSREASGGTRTAAQPAPICHNDNTSSTHSAGRRAIAPVPSSPRARVWLTTALIADSVTVSLGSVRPIHAAPT